MDLHILWFVLLGVFLAGYAVLDGFDLGVGILHPFLARNDHERRLFLNSIGPIWDGNEVWLIVYGGALFAAFPEAYATIFSGFYVALMAVLFGLILRASSIELRSKIHSPAWRHFWDWCFAIGSFLATLVFGVAVGNGMRGIPLNERGVYIGTFLELLNPYALLVGVFTLSMFAMHGSIYLYLKVPAGELQNRLRDWMWHTWGLFLVCYLLLTMYTLVAIPRALANFEQFPWLAAVVVLNVLAIANIPRAIYAGKPGQAFISSSLAIIAFTTLFSASLFPHLVPASNDPALSLTIYNAASGETTLGIMAIMAAIGAPLVLVYTAVVYWTFRGEVYLTDHSY